MILILWNLLSYLFIFFFLVPKDIAHYACFMGSWKRNCMLLLSDSVLCMPIRSCWLAMFWIPRILADILSSSSIICWEWGGKVYNFNYRLFLLSFLSSFAPCIIRLCCLVHAHLRFLCPPDGLILLSLYIVLFV